MVFGSPSFLVLPYDLRSCSVLFASYRKEKTFSFSTSRGRQRLALRPTAAVFIKRSQNPNKKISHKSMVSSYCVEMQQSSYFQGSVPGSSETSLDASGILKGSSHNFFSARVSKSFLQGKGLCIKSLAPA